MGDWTWRWCSHGAPHAPGPNNVSSWDDVPDDDIPRPDAVPGLAAEDAPGQVEDDVPDADDGTTFDLGDYVEQALVRSAVWESLLELIERYDQETMEELEEQ